MFFFLICDKKFTSSVKVTYVHHNNAGYKNKFIKLKDKNMIYSVRAAY